MCWVLTETEVGNIGKRLGGYKHMLAWMARRREMARKWSAWVAANRGNCVVALDEAR